MILGKGSYNGINYYELKSGNSSIWLTPLCFFNIKIFPILKENGFTFDEYGTDNGIYYNGTKLTELDLPIKEVPEVSIMRASSLEQEVMSVNEFSQYINMEKMKSVFGNNTQTQEVTSDVFKQPDVVEINTREELIKYMDEFFVFTEDANFDYEVPRLNQIASNDALFSMDEIIDSLADNDMNGIIYRLTKWHSLRVYSLAKFQKFIGKDEIQFLKEFYSYGIDGIKNTCTEMQVLNNCTESSNYPDYFGAQENCLKRTYRITTVDGIADNFTANTNEIANVFSKSDKKYGLIGGTSDYSGKYNALCFNYACKLGAVKVLLSKYGTVLKILNNTKLVLEPIKVDTGFTTYANLGIALNKESLDKYVKASYILIKEIKNKIVESPCSNMYDVMSYIGMTKYQKVVYTAYYLSLNKEAYDEFLETLGSLEGAKQPDFSTIATWIDGIPQYISDEFGVSNDIEEIREFVYNAERPTDPFLLTDWLMLRTFIAILDQEIEIGYTDTSSITDVSNRSEKAEAIMLYDGNIDDVELGIEELDKTYKSFVYNYYTLLCDRSKANKYIFIRNVIREPSRYMEAEKQFDIGFVADYIPMYQTKNNLAKLYNQSCAMVQNAMLEISQAFAQEITNNVFKVRGDKDILINNSFIFSYYLVQLLYYFNITQNVNNQDIKDKIAKMNEFINLKIEDTNCIITCNLGKMDPFITEGIINVTVRKSAVQILVNHIKQYLNCDVTQQDGTKLRRTYLSIYDYIRLEFDRSNRASFGFNFMLCNGFVDYHKVYSVDTILNVNSVPAMKLFQTPQFAKGSSECFYDSDNAILKYLMQNATPRQGVPNYSEALRQDLMDVMSGNTEIPGFKNVTVPLLYLGELYVNDCLQAQAYLDHVKTCFDTRYADDILDMIEYERVEQTKPDHSGMSKEQLEAESTKVINVESEKLIERKFSRITEDIDYNEVQDFDSLYNYLVKINNVILTNSNIYISANGTNTRVRYDNPELLNNYCYKINDNKYILKCGNLIRQIEV